MLEDPNLQDPAGPDPDRKPFNIYDALAKAKEELRRRNQASDRGRKARRRDAKRARKRNRGRR